MGALLTIAQSPIVIQEGGTSWLLTLLVAVISASAALAGALVAYKATTHAEDLRTKAARETQRVLYQTLVLTELRSEIEVLMDRALDILAARASGEERGIKDDALFMRADKLLSRSKAVAKEAVRETCQSAVRVLMDATSLELSAAPLELQNTVIDRCEDALDAINVEMLGLHGQKSESG